LQIVRRSDEGQPSWLFSGLCLEFVEMLGSQQNASVASIDVAFLISVLSPNIIAVELNRG
jgi:hypothetical protein